MLTSEVDWVSRNGSSVGYQDHSVGMIVSLQVVLGLVIIQTQNDEVWKLVPHHIAANQWLNTIAEISLYLDKLSGTWRTKKTVGKFDFIKIYNNFKSRVYNGLPPLNERNSNSIKMDKKLKYMCVKPM